MGQMRVVGAMAMRGELLFLGVYYLMAGCITLICGVGGRLGGYGGRPASFYDGVCQHWSWCNIVDEVCYSVRAGL
jgi:hypothetical protein